MENISISENDVLVRAIAQFRSWLPSSWQINPQGRKPVTGDHRWDAGVEFKAPTGEAVCLVLDIKWAIDPRGVSRLVTRERPTEGWVPILATSFVSPRIRDLLRESQWGYVDLMGNAFLKIDRPALLIQTDLVEKNPWPEKRPVASLKGPVAGRIVRALCETKLPIGVRALAAQVESTPGYLSRVLDFLNREALIQQSTKGAKGAPGVDVPRRGTVTEVNWQGLLRRWAQDYSLLGSNRTSTFLAPRGLTDLIEKLPQSGLRYALTASLGASKLAPVAPPKLLVCYVDQREAAAKSLDLQPAESGANVVLAEPFDAVIFTRTWERDGLVYAAPPQIVVDLLTSPGRGPEEAEALLTWMQENERSWRV